MTDAAVDTDAETALVEEALDRFLSGNDVTAMESVEFRGKRYDAGLAWVHFPEGRGGLGVRPSLQKDVEVRLHRAGGPPPPPTVFFGVALAGPTVVTHGSDDMVERLLRPMFTGEHVWCQLFSEPGAGSDLASLACKAELDGDEWIVNGQKVWNTVAHLADYGLLVTRTDPDVPKHRGMTYFAIDMRVDGVDVRPLRQITGEAEFNEVYLTDVRIHDSDRLGDVGDGWRVSMTTLMNERTTIGAGSGAPARGTGPIAEALRLWEEYPSQSPSAKDRLMKLWIEAEVLRLTNIRAGSNRREGNPGPEGSIAKLGFAEINQDIYEFCVDLQGAHGQIELDYENRRADVIGLVGPPGTSRKMFLRSRANSIEGGTSEIQRNILGERVLGLPGEPRADKTLPWKEVPRS